VPIPFVKQVKVSSMPKQLGNSFFKCHWILVESIWMQNPVLWGCVSISFCSQVYVDLSRLSLWYVCMHQIADFTCWRSTYHRLWRCLGCIELRESCKMLPKCRESRSCSKAYCEGGQLHISVLSFLLYVLQWFRHILSFPLCWCKNKLHTSQSFSSNTHYLALCDWLFIHYL
jgi:hypothetical protein